MPGRRQHEIDPTYPRAAKRAIQQLARTLDKRMDHVEMQDQVITFFVEFLADQNIILNTNGMFEGVLPSFHTVDRRGRPDSRTFGFHELQQQALKDMLQHNFDHFKIRNDARQQNRKAAHEALTARLVSWRNRAIEAENENTNLIANQTNAGNDANEFNAPNDVDVDQESNEQVVDDHVNDEQVNDVDVAAEAQPDQNQAAQVEAQNLEVQTEPELENAAAGSETEVNQKPTTDDGNRTYEPASYKTAYPNDGGTNGNDTAAEKDAVLALASTEAEVPIKIQPKTSTPIIKKGATAPLPLTTFPVDRLGLNLRRPRTRDRVQTWLDSDPEAETLPITPEYASGISEIEFNDEPEDADLPPTPEFNPTEDIAINEVEVDDVEVKTQNQLITASFRFIFNFFHFN